MQRMNRLALVALATAVAAAVPVTAHAVTGPPTARAASRPAAPHTVLAAATAPRTASVTQVIGSGTMDDGSTWQVSLQYWAKAPAGFVAQDGPVPAGDGVLCQHVVMGGVLVDAQGGKWADCGAENPADPAQEYGLWGLTEKGTAGDRVFVGHPAPAVTRAVADLPDHNTRTAQVVTVPGTSIRAYAVPLSTGETMGLVDEYDAAGQLVDVQSDFH